MQKGRILSIESMGLVDGPGIRCVVFFQGCALRCKFCHNPDSWARGGGTELSSEEIVRKVLRFRPYFARSGGGVTFSGGEPLLQREFLLELLRRCKQEGVHTCLDTAGAGTGGYEEILRLVDLVLYDVKAVTAEGYRSLCGGEIGQTEEFQRAMAACGTKAIVRQVVIPGISDGDACMQELDRYIRKHIPTAVKVELLPYHLMGAFKYEKLGMPPPLAGIPAMDKEKTQQLWERYFKHFGEGNDDERTQRI